MKAVCWFGKEDVRVAEVPDPKILDSRDVLVKVLTTAICGSDLHLYGGFIPAMKKGDILGHEFIGQVMEMGADVHKLKRGDRVIVPFAICCGACFYCYKGSTSLCENTNPSKLNRRLFGYPTAGLYGYSHMYGGYSGGQAEYVRVPWADANAFVAPSSLSNEEILFLTDIFPTGFMAAENCSIELGDTVAVWGCGPVGLFSMKSARLLGAGRIIAVDRFPERLQMAQEYTGAEVIDDSKQDVFKEIYRLTDGRGPMACIDAVGMESHGRTIDAVYDRIKFTFKMETDRPHALRQIIRSCGKGGHISTPGVYSGLIDKFPYGLAFGKGLTMKMGQTHVHRYVQPLLERIAHRELDPTAIITHRIDLEDAADAYKMFHEKKDGCIKVILRPPAVRTIENIVAEEPGLVTGRF